MQKLDAPGRLFSSRDVQEEGSAMIFVTTVVAPEARVTTKKTWMTLKAKYHCWHHNSTCTSLTAPENLANILQTTGTNDIKMDRRTTGSKPVTTPRMGLGISLMKLKKWTLSVKKLMFEIAPTTATGIAHCEHRSQHHLITGVLLFIKAVFHH